jgi:hypothetical protein
VLDQLIPALGNVQTCSASSEESESDQPDHWTQEFFGTDSAWMLKHVNDDKCRDQPQKDAHGPRNYEDDFSDHKNSPKDGRRVEPYLFAGFLPDGIDLAELPSDGIDPPLSTSIPPFSDGAGSAVAAWNAWSFVRPVLLA